MLTEAQIKLLMEIYERYNLSEDEPDIVTAVDDINYLLSVLGMDSVMYKVYKDTECPKCGKVRKTECCENKSG